MTLHIAKVFFTNPNRKSRQFSIQSNGFGRKHSACFSDYAVGGPLLIILHIERVWSTIVSSLLCVCLERSVEVAKKAPHLSLFIHGRLGVCSPMLPDGQRINEVKKDIMRDTGCSAIVFLYA